MEKGFGEKCSGILFLLQNSNCVSSRCSRRCNHYQFSLFLLKRKIGSAAMVKTMKVDREKGIHPRTIFSECCATQAKSRKTDWHCLLQGKMGKCIDRTHKVKARQFLEKVSGFSFPSHKFKPILVLDFYFSVRLVKNKMLSLTFQIVSMLLVDFPYRER